MKQVLYKVLLLAECTIYKVKSKDHDRQILRGFSY